MDLSQSKVGNIFIGDQIAIRLMHQLLFGTVMGFGYTEIERKLNPYLKIAEYPEMKVLIPQVERIINRQRSNK